jgi:hypothetical protein
MACAEVSTKCGIDQTSEDYIVVEPSQLKLDRRISVVNTLSRGFDECFLRIAHLTNHSVIAICNVKQNVDPDDIAKYGINLLPVSYAERDAAMIATAKKTKSLMIAYVRPNYKEHSSGRGTLVTIAMFKGKSKKKYDLMYVPGFDDDVYLISEDPDLIDSHIDDLVEIHHRQIIELVKANGYECIVTSGPVGYPEVTRFAEKLAECLF